MLLPKATAGSRYLGDTVAAEEALAKEELARLYRMYVNFTQRAMHLIPLKVWRQRSGFNLSSMAQMEAPSGQWLMDACWNHLFYCGHPWNRSRLNTSTVVEEVRRYVKLFSNTDLHQTIV